ncbi:MAG TPA: CCC motif membrane protein [Flavobacterium sp.]|nr:CCC motif membrane protein [Flavobacterium sp.]
MGNQKLPNATAVLVLGIFSILACCFYGIGIILGAVALILAQKDMALYRQNPDDFSNYSTLNTGKILAIIGISISLLYLILIIWAISTFGLEALQDQELLQEKINEMFGQ